MEMKSAIMKVVALIPIRMNNERLPAKNINPFFESNTLMHFFRVCVL